MELMLLQHEQELMFPYCEGCSVVQCIGVASLAGSGLVFGENSLQYSGLVFGEKTVSTVVQCSVANWFLLRGQWPV